MLKTEEPVASAENHGETVIWAETTPCLQQAFFYISFQQQKPLVMVGHNLPAEAPSHSPVHLSGKPPDIVQVWGWVWYEQFQITPRRWSCLDWGSPSFPEVGTWAQCCKSALLCSDSLIGLSIKGTCALSWLWCGIPSMFWLSLLKGTDGKEPFLHRLFG